MSVTEGDHHASVEHLERLAERTAALQKTREAERQRLVAQVAEMEASTRTKDAEARKLERKVQQLEQGLSEKERHAGESSSRSRSLERALVAAEASTVAQEEKAAELSAQLKSLTEDNKALKAQLDKAAAQAHSYAASMAVDTEALEAEAAELRDTNRTLEVKCQTLNTRLRESEEGRQREQDKIKAERMKLEVAQERCVSSFPLPLYFVRCPSPRLLASVSSLLCDRICAGTNKRAKSWRRSTPWS